MIRVVPSLVPVPRRSPLLISSHPRAFTQYEIYTYRTKTGKYNMRKPKPKKTDEQQQQQQQQSEQQQTRGKDEELKPSKVRLARREMLSPALQAVTSRHAYLPHVGQVHLARLEMRPVCGRSLTSRHTNVSRRCCFKRWRRFG